MMRLSVPIATTLMLSVGGDPAIPPMLPAAPTPEVSLPPRLCQPGVIPAVFPANWLYQAALSVPRANTIPTPRTGLAAPRSPLTRAPSRRQLDQWVPSLVFLTHTAWSVPTASTYSVPPTFTAAGPLPASTRPPRLRQGRTARPDWRKMHRRSQTGPSAARTNTSRLWPLVTAPALGATPGRDVSRPPRDLHLEGPALEGPKACHSALSVPRPKTISPSAAPGPPMSRPPSTSPAPISSYTRWSVPV